MDIGRGINEIEVINKKQYNMSYHDAIRQSQYLRQTLSQDKKPTIIHKRDTAIFPFLIINYF